MLRTPGILTMRLPIIAAAVSSAFACFQPARAQTTATQTTAPAAEAPKLYDGFEGYARKVTTTSAEAQRWFDQGIQLLYGFNHDEAIRSFEQAAAIDPQCAMAWWGSAYARGIHINNPVMGEEQSRQAYEAARKALAAIERASPVEQALIRAVATRYAWPAPEDRGALDEAYAAEMERAWHAFPSDPDVGALFAESLMNLQPWDLWTAEAAPKGRALEVAAVLEKVLARTPQHPGANHFYIHAIEASPWPERGLDAAERLGTLVPGSGHLVHMPSHIYIRTGRYERAVTANQKAIAADLAYFTDAPEPEFYAVYFLHNAHFLAYAAMMEGRFATALEAARMIEKSVPPAFLKEFAPVADGFMPTALHVLLRFGKWEEILKEPEPQAFQLVTRAERHFARAVAYANLGNTTEARHELAALRVVAAEIDAAEAEWKVGNNLAPAVMAVAQKMAEGEILYREGKKDAAFARLHEAVQLEEALSYDEPPGWMQPVRHALGALLMAEGSAAEAEEVYRADLERHPRNAWSLLGLKQALEGQQKSAEVEVIAAEVDAAWARADVMPPGSCYCREQ
jgi:tetratricopeptide (TPR) repeat protein